jgi:hypothetical protein
MNSLRRRASAHALRLVRLFATFASKARLRSRPLAAVVALVPSLVLTTAACKGHGKESASRASQDDAFLVELVAKDVAEIERGLPQGARALGPLVADGADPRQDIAAVRKALGRIRRDVPDLDVAKSTFFALADASGVAIRNDLEEDVMAGQNLMAVFPALAGAKNGFVTTTGRFPNAGGKNGPDKDWVAGAPVKRADGTTGAILVTGWTYRYFARHLQSSLESRLLDQAKAEGAGSKLPVYYVAVFDDSGVYAAPLTPQVDEQALAAEALSTKTASGPAQGVLTITDREFGYAAQRTPKLGPTIGVVVLRSEL